MTRFEIDFDPHPFEKTAVEQTKSDVWARLDGHDLGPIKIVLKRKPGNHIALQFFGDPESVEKAKNLLGID